MTLRLKGENSGDVSLKAPATAGDNTITLPTSNGSANQYLKNGSTAGVLEFGTLPSSGKILQVVQAVETSVVSDSSITAGTFETVLSASITPSSSSNKVLVMYSSNASTTTANAFFTFRVARGSTAIGIGDADGSRTRSGVPNQLVSYTSQSMAFSQVILDSPSTTSATTYNLQYSGEAGVGTLVINRGATSDSANTNTGATHLILMEVAA